MEINKKVLELIAKELGELDSGPSLVNFLVEMGIARNKIDYPNTKWRTLRSVFEDLNINNSLLLSEILAKAVHPLTFCEGDEEKANKLKNKFNLWLKYDNLIIDNHGIRKIHSYEESLQEQANTDEMIADSEENEALFIKRNLKGIDDLVKYYKSLIDSVALYLRDKSSPSVNLNKVYASIRKAILGLITKLSDESNIDWREISSGPPYSFTNEIKQNAYIPHLPLCLMQKTK